MTEHNRRHRACQGPQIQTAQIQTAQIGMPRGLAWGLLGCVVAIALPVIGEVIFGLLGVTSEDPTWVLVPLFGVLWSLVAVRLPVEWYLAMGAWPGSLPRVIGLAGAGRARRGPALDVQAQDAQAKVFKGIAGGLTWASRIAAGALLGFFYGGRWTGNDLRGAIAGLLIGLILALFAGLWLAKCWTGVERVLGVAIALCAAYGLWFWLGAWALSALMAGCWFPALLYGGVALNFGHWAWLGLVGLGRGCFGLHQPGQ